MNSWNGSYWYAQNVKIHNIFKWDAQDKIYDLLLWDDADIYYDDINSMLKQWENEEGVKFWYHTEDKEHMLSVATDMEKQKKMMEDAGWTFERAGTERATYKKKNVRVSNYQIWFNGRSSGYLVLYKWNGYNYTGSGMYYDREDLRDMSISEVDDIYQILRSMDKCIKGIKKYVLSCI